MKQKDRIALIMRDMPQTGHFYVLNIVALLFIIGILIGLTFRPRIGELDTTLYALVKQWHAALHAPFVDAIALFFTNLANVEVIVTLLIMAVVLLYRKKRHHAAQALIASVFTSIVLVQSIKFAIDRVRPEPFISAADTFGMSFPSGHAFVAIVFYGTVAYIIGHHIKKKKRRWLVYNSAQALVWLIALSRLWLGVHWLSDVVAGMILGGLLLWVIVAFYTYNKPREPLFALWK